MFIDEFIKFTNNILCELRCTQYVYTRVYKVYKEYYLETLGKNLSIYRPVYKV